jgi:hypothetical protein
MMSEVSMTTNRVPWYLWPFHAIWSLFAWIVKLTGRLLAVILGFVLVIVGAVLSITVILLPLGIPMMAFGFMLALRGLF